MKVGTGLLAAISLPLFLGPTFALADCNPSTGAASGKPTPDRQHGYVAGQQGPSGGSGGDYCWTNESLPEFRLVGISVRSQNTIDSIYLDYKAPEGRINQEARDKYGHLRCGGDGGRPSPEPPLTLDDGEVIVRVSGRYGGLRGEIGEFVNWLYIQTDGGPRGPQFRTFATKGSPGRKRPANHAWRRDARRERFAHWQIEGRGCSGIGERYASGVQFQGSRASIRLIGWSAMRARMSRR